MKVDVELISYAECQCCKHWRPCAIVRTDTRKFVLRLCRECIVAVYDAFTNVGRKKAAND